MKTLLKRKNMKIMYDSNRITTKYYLKLIRTEQKKKIMEKERVYNSYYFIFPCELYDFIDKLKLNCLYLHMDKNNITALSEDSDIHETVKAGIVKTHGSNGKHKKYTLTLPKKILNLDKIYTENSHIVLTLNISLEDDAYELFIKIISKQ